MAVFDKTTIQKLYKPQEQIGTKSESEIPNLERRSDDERLRWLKAHVNYPLPNHLTVYSYDLRTHDLPASSELHDELPNDLVRD